MGAFKWPLFFVFLWFKVVQTEASTWTATVPSSVQGINGSCVVIPCSYNYPESGKQITGYTGIWYKVIEDVIYHKDNNQIKQEYKGRTELVGDITQKNCSLKIDPLRQSDRGPFYFRIELGGYNRYSYRNNEVSITVISAPQPTVSVKEEVVEGQNVSASCSVSHSCPSSPPEFTWTHSGEKHFQSQQLTDGQWKATSVLTFHPTKADHNKPLSCTVRYKGGLERKQASNVLKVKYAPVNVTVDYKSHVKEGETVQLKCSSEANPPANSYLWKNKAGARLHQGQSYKLINVSRHTGVLYCTANNTVGESKSSPVQLNVSYAPVNVKVDYKSHVKEGETVQLKCSSEANPPANSYLWHNEEGAQLHQGQSYKLINVSRHTGALYCTAINTVGESKSSPVQLNVSYAPVNVKVDYKSHVKEGETVQLKCSSEANPPANSYLWKNEAGARLHQGQSYKLINVSRHTGVLYCTAINTVGESKSSPVQLNVSFAPEIKNISCSSEDDVVKCVCIVESSPPSMVHFVLSDRVLSSTKTETHGFNTTETLHTKSGSSEFVQCLANNTLGKVSLTIPLAVNGKMQNLYIFIAIGAGTGLVILLIVLGVVRKCRGRTEDTAACVTEREKAVDHQYASTKRGPGDLPTAYDSVTKTAETVEFQIQMDDEDIHDPDDHVYGNTETDCNEEIYANV
ncbi:B-cell receptor CD22-like isoform X2 [Anabas testudineus]|uniref:B-cell receptor CD22-like isoform X2 n=1 Tax=Anabas testudineus TaxID=64144 RepID=UPI000E45E665|nr:B-cell receptor CD22-like isoform X2 [Anabas testudineus]